MILKICIYIREFVSFLELPEVNYFMLTTEDHDEVEILLNKIFDPNSVTKVLQEE